MLAWNWHRMAAAYATRTGAQAVADERNRDKSHSVYPWRVFHCKVCDFWHVVQDVGDAGKTIVVTPEKGTQPELKE